eukprot:m.694559 g.694559  ORF g.694559 m.694559 type:complete len:297 (-) comp22882_c0_seq14:889-1779(-)
MQACKLQICTHCRRSIPTHCPGRVRINYASGCSSTHTPVPFTLLIPPLIPTSVGVALYCGGGSLCNVALVSYSGCCNPTSKHVCAGECTDASGSRTQSIQYTYWCHSLAHYLEHVCEGVSHVHCSRDAEILSERNFIITGARPLHATSAAAESVPAPRQHASVCSHSAGAPRAADCTTPLAHSVARRTAISGEVEDLTSSVAEEHATNTSGDAHGANSDPAEAAVRMARSDTAIALLTKLMTSVTAMTNRHSIVENQRHANALKRFNRDEAARKRRQEKLVGVDETLDTVSDSRVR